jgi:broad specificity phosphatase PhoE
MNMKARPILLLVSVLLAAGAGPANGQQTIILVRHAEVQGVAMAAPKSLPLSPEGEARASRLSGILKDASVDAIFVTDYARTAETAAPLARALARPLTVVPKGDPQDLVNQLRTGHPTQTVLVVGHTDTLPGLAKALGHPATLKIEAQDYGNIFILTPRANAAPTFLRLRY